jgi:hypothetical protein
MFPSVLNRLISQQTTQKADIQTKRQKVKQFSKKQQCLWKKYSLHQGDNRNDIQQLSSTEIFSRSAEKFMVFL